MSNHLRGINTAGLKLRLVDAKDLVVGRLAAQLAVVLQGKDKPSYAPHKDEGDIIVVKNARHVDFTGKKWDQKLYRWHTGYPGGLKERTAKQQMYKDPTQILYNAVYGMLPKNKLRKARARKLRIFPDEEHPFANHPELVRWETPPRNIRVKEELWAPVEGEWIMNPDAYLKRYRHMLSPEQIAIVNRQSEEWSKQAKNVEPSDGV
jgi:large subunit ribosomal protein L13